MKTAQTANEVVAPRGMSGLACEPWTPGEIYAVAADWAQAASPVLVYGEDGWTHDEHGRQVADFSHDAGAALAVHISEAITMSGEEPEDAEVDGIIEDAVHISDED